MAEERFKIRIDSIWQPFLLLVGATDENSYVVLEDGRMTLRFGWLFQRDLQLGQVESVQEASWPLWYGVGLRTNFLGLYGLIGSYRGVVELKLRERMRLMGVLSCRRLAVSLEEPQRFVEAVARAALKAASNSAAAAPAG